MASSNVTGQSALHEAILRKDSQKVDELLQNISTDVNKQDKDGNTPLHCAAITGELKLVRELIGRKVEVNAANKRGETALHLAAQYDEVMVTLELLQNLADIDAADVEHLTPFLKAAKHGCPRVVDTLLQENIQLDVKDKNNKTVVYLATENNNIDVLKVLLKYDSNNHYNEIKELVNIEDDKGMTPLLIAATRGHVECMNEILKNDADVNHTCGENNAARVGEEKKTALHFAAEGGWTVVVTQLLKSGKVLIAMKDKAGKTALHDAVIQGMKRTVVILLQKGADVDALDGQYRTPLSYAAEKGHTKCARALLNKGAKLNMGEASKHQLTAVQFAAQSGHSEVVQLLAEESVKVAEENKTIAKDMTKNILALTDFRKRNCLDIAVENNHKETVLTIIQTDQWEDVLRNHTDQFESPMRKLIRYMPDAAREVFNRCTTVSEKTGEFQVDFNYEFLDDSLFLGKWKKDGTYRADEPYTSNAEIIRDNHPLMIMVTSRRKELLDHPLVTALLKKKWHSVGPLVFHLINFLIYAIYLAMLTGFTLDIKAPFQFANITTDEEACSEENIALYKIPKFAAAAKYFVIILAVVELIKEISEMVLVFSCRFWIYFMGKENILEWITYLTSLMFVVNTNACEDFGYRPQWQWTCGTISVFLAWINLLLFTQKFEWLGIYVVMFYRILKVFLKFFFVFSLLIVAFSVSFHCLFQNQEQFGTFWTSLVKTTAMMIGELDFGSIFYDQDVHYGVISYLFFYIFMLFMAIVIINLLIGLAVNNIQEFQEKAGLNKKEMQVKFALEFEKTFFKTPINPLRRYVKQNVITSTGNTTETLNLSGNTTCSWMQKKIRESWGLTAENIKRSLNQETDGLERERLHTEVKDLETNMKTKMRELDSKLTFIVKSLNNLEAMVDNQRN